MMTDGIMEDEARMPENFAQHPVSLTEAKAGKSGDAALWTPRDALISALRRLDSGEINPSSIFIWWNDRTDRETYGFSQVSRDHRDAESILSRLWFKFMSGEL